MYSGEADIKKLMTLHLNKGYAFTTTKKTYSILKMYFDHLFREGQINYNPMAMITMIKKANYDAAQNKETKAKCDEVTVFTDEELELIRAEAFRKFGNGKPVYQQSGAYFLMLNTGLRAGELCGIINSDIDLENRVVHIQRGVKEIHVRDGLEYSGRLEVKVGKLKSKTSRRDVPLNDKAIEIRTGKILQMTARHYAGFERHGNSGQIFVHRLLAREPELIEYMIVTAGNKYTGFPDIQIPDQFEILFCGADPRRDFREGVAQIHTSCNRLAVLFTVDKELGLADNSVRAAEPVHEFVQVNDLIHRIRLD